MLRVPLLPRILYVPLVPRIVAGLSTVLPRRPIQGILEKRRRRYDEAESRTVPSTPATMNTQAD